MQEYDITTTDGLVVTVQLTDEDAAARGLKAKRSGREEEHAVAPTGRVETATTRRGSKG